MTAQICLKWAREERDGAMREAELAAIQERLASNYTGWPLKHFWQDLKTLLTYVRELQGQVADLWDESRAYELGRMAERGVILAAIKKIRQMRRHTWNDPFNGDPAQIALDLVACKLTGPVRPLPHPEQLAAEYAESRAYEMGRMAERGQVLKILRESADFWQAIREVEALGPSRPLPPPEQLAAENALLYAALYRLRNRLGDVPWLTEQDGELTEGLKQAIAALNGAKEV
jgi:hypothetical protein